MFLMPAVIIFPQVAHMTKSEMHLHDLAFLGPGLLFLDQYFNSFIDEYLVLWIALVRTCLMPPDRCLSHLDDFKVKKAQVQLMGLI